MSAAATRGPQVVVATSNPGKLREFRAILADLDVEWLGLEEAGHVEFPEEGLDYEANAMAKARAAADQLGLPALADDSDEPDDVAAAAAAGRARPQTAHQAGNMLSDFEVAAKRLDALKSHERNRQKAMLKEKLERMAALIA